ncbi:MAG: hypothetical protein ACFCUR_11005 [Rhodomicrobiaceae bacterium]
MPLYRAVALAVLPCFALSMGVADRVSAAPIISPSIALPDTARSPLILVQGGSAEFSAEDISGPPGEPLPLQIQTPSGVTDQSGLVMIRGVPQPLTLSAGFLTGDTWMVSLKELENLTIDVPDGFQGAFDYEVILVLGTSSNRESRKASVTIAEETAALPDSEPRSDRRLTSARAQDPVPPAETTQSAPAPRLSPSVEKPMLDQATALLQNGDVASARLLYEHLAKQGSALGALSLAKTYDAEVLLGLGVVGMRPDRAEARRWYEVAAQLGSEPAQQRLETLSAGR